MPHPKENFYECPVCGFYVDRPNKLPAHINTHRKYALTAAEDARLNTYLNLTDEAKLNNLEPSLKRKLMPRQDVKQMNKRCTEVFRESHQKRNGDQRAEVPQPRKSVAPSGGGETGEDVSMGEDDFVAAREAMKQLQQQDDEEENEGGEGGGETGEDVSMGVDDFFAAREAIRKQLQQQGDEEENEGGEEGEDDQEEEDKEQSEEIRRHRERQLDYNHRVMIAQVAEINAAIQARDSLR